MPLGDRSWDDKKENYVDSYLLAVAGTTATAINSSGASPYLLQPIVVYSVTVSVGNAGATGDVTLADISASGDVGGRLFRVHVASGAGGENVRHIAFPRGLVFNEGVMVSATTVTGTIVITYKNRYE